MWSGRHEGKEVTCIACGDSLAREEAREYDKHGDRWDREGKEFEHLCKPCFREISKADRDGLEGLLCDLGAGEVDRAEFLGRYLDAAAREDVDADRGTGADADSDGRRDDRYD
jgi:hypothetical protein